MQHTERSSIVRYSIALYDKHYLSKSLKSTTLNTLEKELVYFFIFYVENRLPTFYN